ncbi:MAG: hypothetical protein ABSH00_16830 [Bryobacteraceae bacterium]|jgi:hypothetical protein
MHATEDRETAETTGTGFMRSGGSLSRLATPALGAGAYLLLAAVVDVGVIRVPDGNRYLQTALLTLLGLAFVAAAEGFLAVIRAIPPREMLGWPFRAAAAGSVAYSLVYGHRVFVNYWFYDDWDYLFPHSLDKAWITGPLNDHFVPLLKIVLWGMRSAFGFDYIGAACLQQAAFLVIVVVLAHLLWTVAHRPWILIVLVGLFAMWPSYGAARTWFGGGFWLTASTALLFVYVLQARRIVFAETMRLTDVAVSVVLAVATVFISSQTLAPCVYLAAFCAPALLFSQRRNVIVRRLGMLCAISLAPTILALWGRSVYVGRVPIHFSGLFDGSLFANLAIFILHKVLFVNSVNSLTGSLPRLAVYSVCLLTLAGAVTKLAASKAIDTNRRVDLAGLILGGCTVFVVPLVQIGVARRWSFYGALGPYYVTLPFLGLWLAGAGIVLTLLARPQQTAQRDNAVLSAWSVALAIMAVISAAGLAAAIQPHRPTLAQRLQIIHVQRQFIASLGAAACDLAALHHNGPAVRWVPRYDISNCSVCQDIIGPPQYVHDLGFDSLVRFAARRSCPAADLTGVLVTASEAPSAAVTDGTESEAASTFVRQYLAPTNRAIAVP